MTEENTKMISIEEAKQLLTDMVEKDMITDDNGINKPSDKFVNTMKAMSEIMMGRLDPETEQTKKFEEQCKADPSLFLDGLLMTTVVHFNKFHLNIDRMMIEDVEKQVSMMKQFYPEDTFLDTINNFGKPTN